MEANNRPQITDNRPQTADHRHKSITIADQIRIRKKLIAESIDRANRQKPAMTDTQAGNVLAGIIIAKKNGGSQKKVRS